MKITATSDARAYHRVLERFAPPASIDYMARMMAERRISLRMAKPRKTKLGDYRSGNQERPPAISLNSNLNPYAFVIVLLHEIAHHDTFRRYGSSVKPHGPEWQQAYRRISQPVLEARILPDDLQSAFARYLHEPAASSCTDHNLLRVMRVYDLPGSHEPGFRHSILEDLPEGARFRWRDGRFFVKMEKVRTRIRCYETQTRRIYLFHSLAEVAPDETS